MNAWGYALWMGCGSVWWEGRRCVAALRRAVSRPDQRASMRSCGAGGNSTGLRRRGLIARRQGDVLARESRRLITSDGRAAPMGWGRVNGRDEPTLAPQRAAAGRARGEHVLMQPEHGMMR